MKKKKVLVLGIGQSNYILQLYGTIKNRLPDFSFSISGFRVLFGKNEYEKAIAIFDEILDWTNRKWSFFSISYAFIYVLFKKWIYKDIAVLWLDGKLNIKTLIRAIYRDNIKPFLVAKKINDSDFNILHFHFIRSRYVNMIKYLDNRFIIICSFWGSDLMRTSGQKEELYQSFALNKSQIITSATYDMGNIILSKYGRNLEHKIKYLKFIHDYKIYELIDYYRKGDDWKIKFRNKYSIPLGNKIIIIGHNATPQNNHIKIIESFVSLTPEEQKEITCIIPMTYADKQAEYINLLHECIIGFNMQFILLDRFMEWDELAQLKLISDVMIHMPTSDGLSAALTEFFFAGGLSVTASWLPYSTFSQAGLFYFNYKSFEDLKSFWVKEFRKMEIFKEKLNANIEIIRTEFNIDSIANDWQKLFQSIEVESK